MATEIDRSMLRSCRSSSVEDTIRHSCWMRSSCWTVQSAEFDQELVSKGELSPVFFGSALTNFGVEIFLKHFLKMTTSPLPRKADCGMIDPYE